LIFDRADIIRRVWRYPAAWRLASEAALIALAEMHP